MDCLAAASSTLTLQDCAREMTQGTRQGSWLVKAVGVEAQVLTKRNGYREFQLCSQVQECEVQTAAFCVCGCQLWEPHGQAVSIHNDVCDP